LQRARLARRDMIVPVHHESNMSLLHIQLLEVRQPKVKGIDGAHGSVQRAQVPRHLHYRIILLW
jgi:hypothetical protein